MLQAGEHGATVVGDIEHDDDCQRRARRHYGAGGGELAADKSALARRRTVGCEACDGTVPAEELGRLLRKLRQRAIHVRLGRDDVDDWRDTIL